MLKIFLKNGLFYFLGFVLIVLPSYLPFILQNNEILRPIGLMFGTLVLLFTLPYWIVGGVYLDYKSRSRFIIWRLFPTCICFCLGYMLEEVNFTIYYIHCIDSSPSMHTTLIIKYYCLIVCIIIAIVIAICQLVILFVNLYQKKKYKKAPQEIIE